MLSHNFKRTAVRSFLSLLRWYEVPRSTRIVGCAIKCTYRTTGSRSQDWATRREINWEKHTRQFEISTERTPAAGLHADGRRTSVSRRIQLHFNPLLNTDISELRFFLWHWEQNSPIFYSSLSFGFFIDRLLESFILRYNAFFYLGSYDHCRSQAAMIRPYDQYCLIGRSVIFRQQPTSKQHQCRVSAFHAVSMSHSYTEERNRVKGTAGTSLAGRPYSLLQMFCLHAYVYILVLQNYDQPINHVWLLAHFPKHGK